MRKPCRILQYTTASRGGLVFQCKMLELDDLSRILQTVTNIEKQLFFNYFFLIISFWLFFCNFFGGFLKRRVNKTIWDIYTLKKNFYVKLMLPKSLRNYTKFATKFLKICLPPRPFWTMFKKLQIWNSMASLSRLSTTLLNLRQSPNFNKFNARS